MSYLETKKVFSERHKQLLAEARAAFSSRSLPKIWEVGQKVRYLSNSDWAWSEGSTAYVVKIRDEYKGKPAADYQVFYTGQLDGKGGIYWTTPDDVELVVD